MSSFMEGFLSPTLESLELNVKPQSQVSTPISYLLFKVFWGLYPMVFRGSYEVLKYKRRLAMCKTINYLNSYACYFSSVPLLDLEN